MKIYLLSHESELSRGTNTGSIALENGNGIVERILWQRKKPNEKLVNLITRHQALLLYPKEGPQTGSIVDYENLIIIDGTWQESRKIYNKSEYLKQMSHTNIQSAARSRYKLRRNQKQHGLCTIECVIEALKLKGLSDLASQLDVEFEQFNQTRTDKERTIL